MGRKIFVSYKYSDDRVQNLSICDNSTVRDYVTKLENTIAETDHIYKGESEDEDLSQLSEETIWQKLRDRIYDSSLTIVFISPGMRNMSQEDKEQWIPWEISYSLKETKRKNKNGDSITSKTNAMLAVVIPDVNGDYSYCLENRTCCSSKCVVHHTDNLFKIIKENKFNLKDAKKIKCQNDDTVWCGAVSYIEAVRWDDFISNYNIYIDRAYNRQKNIEDYKIRKEI